MGYMPKTSTASTEPRRLRVAAPAPRAAGGDREEALRRVRRARRHVEPDRSGTGRFAHLKRVYD